MYLVQVWAMPGIIDLKEAITLNSDPTIVIKHVQHKRKNDEILHLTLIQTAGSQKTMSECAQYDIYRIGTVLRRLSFSLLHQLNVVSARVVNLEKKEDGSFEEMNCAGSPAGVSLFEYMVGFKQYTQLESSFLLGEISPNVDAAIGWFLHGNNSANSIQRVLCYWIGLETLSTKVKGPWRCDKCESDINACPVCGKSTIGHKAVLTIKQYIVGRLGVESKKFSEYYKVRNNLSHGEISMSSDSIAQASKAAIDLQQILLMAIKIELGWPTDNKPVIEKAGVTLIGQPWLIGTCKYDGDPSFDGPACLPF